MSKEILDNFDRIKVDRLEKSGQEILLDRYSLQLNELNELEIKRTRSLSINWLMYVLGILAFVCLMVYVSNEKLTNPDPEADKTIVILLALTALAALFAAVFIIVKRFSKKASWVFSNDSLIRTNDVGKKTIIPLSVIDSFYVSKTLVMVNGFEDHYNIDICIRFNDITSFSPELFSIGGPDAFSSDISHYDDKKVLKAVEDAMKINLIIHKHIRRVE